MPVYDLTYYKHKILNTHHKARSRAEIKSIFLAQRLFTGLYKYHNTSLQIVLHQILKQSKRNHFKVLNWAKTGLGTHSAIV